jgi:predicted transcriptional regulator
MFVKDLMTSAVVCCTPWDTAQEAADLMKTHGVARSRWFWTDRTRYLRGL